MRGNAKLYLWTKGNESGVELMPCHFIFLLCFCFIAKTWYSSEKDESLKKKKNLKEKISDI